MAIRSGRFKASGLTTAPLTVVKSTKNGGVYRFLNAGARDFTITGYPPLKPAQSLDIGIDGKKDLIITAPDSDEADGIYDLLSGSQPVRSGRFKVRAASGSPAPAQKIIVLESGVDSQIYRFFNSGDDVDNSMLPPTVAKFELSYQVGGGSPKKIADLKPGFSIDVEVKGGQTIIVKGIEDGLTIEGIYEFLGSES